MEDIGNTIYPPMKAALERRDVTDCWRRHWHEDRGCRNEVTEEGCLSLSGSRKTERYREVELEYQDLNMQKHRQKFSGWTAQIVQHECDHLEGIII